MPKNDRLAAHGETMGNDAVCTYSQASPAQKKDSVI